MRLTILFGTAVLPAAQTVETSLSFTSPADAKKLHLTGDRVSMAWVYLCLDSDPNPLHPRTLLRVL